MSNRFNNPNVAFADSTGAPYSGGSLYFYATGTTTPQNTYSDSTLLVANTNPVVLDSAGRAGNIFLSDAAYKVILKDSSGNTIFTADPVSTSDYSTNAKVHSGAGSPNGTVAGTQGSATIPADMYWDTTNNILYVCTTTGTSSTAVWTAINSSASTPAYFEPQGRLTLTSATPVLAADVSAATAVYYALHKGNLVPIYNGSTMVPTEFTELTLTLVSQHALSTIYDVFVFSNSGVLTLVTGPAWSTSTAGAGSRGTGAGTTELQRIKGLWTNAVSMTGRNGSTTYTVGANRGTYLGSILIDGTAGQVSSSVAFGASRKCGVWNAYQKTRIEIVAGDSTASWTYASATIRQSNAAAGNKLTTLCGLPDERIFCTFTQKFGENAKAGGAAVSYEIGIGLNSTTVMSGTRGIVYSDVQASDSVTVRGSPTAFYTVVPGIGINNINALESGDAGQTGVFFGTESYMRLSATYFG